jgi:hypothetical protein
MDLAHAISIVVARPLVLAVIDGRAGWRPSETGGGLMYR